MKFIIGIIFITNAVIASAVSSRIYQFLFENWKINYNKTYPNSEEEASRFQKWQKNLLTVHKHNLEYQRNKQTFRMEMNHLADMTADEINEILMGNNDVDEWKQPPGTQYMKLLHVSDEDLPENVDWRGKGLVTNVKNQGLCGACYAFASMGALEGQYARKHGVLRSLSAQNVVDCSSVQHNLGCKGGLSDNSYRYLIQNGGVDTWDSYPYEAKVGKCRFKPKSIGATIHSYVDLPKGNEQMLKEAVATIGPVSVSMDSRHAPFHFYAYGIYQNPNCNSSHLTHAVLAVGYGTTESGQDYWLIKNSWGNLWGEHGYFRMVRNHNNHCGISNQGNYPLL